MPRFAANLTTLFTELPFLDRFAAAAAAGFEAVECLWPYEWPAGEIAARLQAHGLRQVLFNLSPGDARGDRGMACHPGREAEFMASLEQALAYARALGCPRLHVMAGLCPAGVPRAALGRTFVTNLRHAAERAAAAGVKLLVEPLNAIDNPGYFLTTIEEGLALVEAVGPDKLGLQFDIYHRQMTAGDVARALEAALPYIGHIQIADVPGRHEPGTGEINWHFLLAHLDRIGYRGWVGCEYRPRAGTREGLGWLAPFRGR